MNQTPAPSPDKRALRARLRAARDAFVAGGAPALTPPAAFLEALAPGRVVASYLPLGSEANPVALVEAARQLGCILALPRTVTREAPITFHLWDPEVPSETGPFGLRQPPASAALVTPDIVLLPLVGFDAACNRLGQGAGHYDRALAMLPGVRTLGIAWSVQQVDVLPVDPWDQPLDAIATERDYFVRGTV